MADFENFDFSKGVKSMTNGQFNAFLELLAQLIEAKAVSIKDAAEIVRNTKTTA